MGRKRKKSNDKLPDYVYLSKGRYVYKPYLGRKDGKTTFGKEIVLCGKDSSITQIWTAYDQIKSIDTGTIKWMLDQYHASDKFKTLSASTKSQYGHYYNTITTFPTAAGDTWGETPIAATSPKTIRLYLDKREHKKGGNREIQYLKAAFSWAYQRLDNVLSNPCKGVDLNEETPRDRYVEDWEYDLVYRVAKSMRAPYFAPAMELAFLARARRIEVFSYTLDDMKEAGLYLKRSKGSEDEITGWSPRLMDAIELCKANNPEAPRRIKGQLLLHDKQGLAYTKNALDSAWQRIIAKAMTKGAVIDGRTVLLKERFNFHDLKAKAYSDMKGEQFAGHKSERMHAVYNRKAREVPATK